VTASQLLTALFNAGIAISVGATVLSLGMTFTVRELVAPLHRVVLVIVMVVLNAVVIPAAAWGIAGASISAWQIVKSLLLLVLLPLVAGLFIRARYADHAKDWRAELVKVANLALVIALATGISANWSTIVSMFGSWVIGAALIIVIVAAVLGLLPGLLLGGRSAEIRTTTGLVSVFRFASLGLIIIGAQLHGNPVYLGPAITFALVDFVLPLALAVEIGHQGQRT